MKSILYLLKRYSILIFTFYLLTLVFLTLFSYNYYIYGKSSNYLLFSSIKLMLHSQDPMLILKNIIGNVVLFLPFGLFLPVINRMFSSVFLIFIISFFTSLIIEILQKQIANRIFDIDDILLNVCGALLGLFFVKTFNYLSFGNLK
ncbi:hypothetical protein AWM68_15945 [Fictibacillus phosphorivorans]|uniref:VanZ-like domain-containing protein n=1 Tax=Fictibacillus phosphorivorans TaxID=1221500 RepID=A0A165MTF0_9BACL|nr:hypothetical protein AWM68_15945 [Fictibacillus phosphorivorans]